MIRVCMNCDTENPADAVTCSECGMSLTRAPTGETAEKARARMARARSVNGDAQDSTEPGAKQMRYIRWGLGLAGMACWTILVGTGGYCFGILVGMSSGGFNPPHDAQWYADRGIAIIYGASALALAPWIVGGIVLGVRWRRSRASEAPEDTEQDAG
ncbi:MAG: hypothetical protein CEE40_05805 [Chloroflexi bacterium B3_Chlor]|nr:MAG: hypothetical protein CEE40_05805 [Chloroflexi bacterium B3_Chlor]